MMRYSPDLPVLTACRRSKALRQNLPVEYAAGALLLMLTMLLHNLDVLAGGPVGEQPPVSWPSAARQLSSAEEPSQYHVITGLAVTDHLDVAPHLPGITASRFMSFRPFMHELEESNLDLAAQAYNVPIASAQADAAQVYPDPVFQGGYGGDISHQKQDTTYAPGLTQTVLLGGKIKARRRVAKNLLESSKAQLADLVRDLRAEAANAFVDGLVGQLIVKRREKGLRRAQQLVQFNQKRMPKERVAEIELLRSRLAALQARDDLLGAQQALQQALVELTVLLGRPAREGLVVPVGNLDIPPRQFNLEALVAQALTSRSDIVATRAAVDVANAQYQLVVANRVPDLTIGVIYSHFTQVTNPIDPVPAWNSLALSLSIPIPLSNLNHGQIEAARYAEKQAERQLQALLLRAETQVRGSYEQYILARATVEQYASELVGDASRVYKARLYRMEHGEASLLDVLDAHHAVNDVYLGYYGALSAQAKSLISLEQASGIWDIDF
jgi:cobalt-zinc-cadmium efflux system outer membrane protein